MVVEDKFIFDGSIHTLELKGMKAEMKYLEVAAK
jgi:hypothetical protein